MSNHKIGPSSQILELAFKIWYTDHPFTYHFLFISLSSCPLYTLFSSVHLFYSACLLTAMSARRRTPADISTLRRSRSSFIGAITKARDKLKGYQDGPFEDYTARAVDRILSSVSNTEKGYLQTVEDAVEFIPTDESGDDIQQEEDEAVEAFTNNLSDVRDIAASLLSLKMIKRHIDDMKCDLSAVRDAFTLKPEANQDSTLRALEASYSAVRKEWNEAEHHDDNPLKAKLDNCRLLITQLSSEMAGPKERSATSTLDTSFSSSCCSHVDRDEDKLPTINVPTFHGDIMEWSSFWAAFTSTVGRRERLPDTSKLIYLRQAIKDPDTQTLLHSPSETPGFYNEVVKALHARFDRTKEIHRNLVQKLLQMNMVKHTRTDLRRLVDNLNHTIASIKTTGHYNLDAFLTSLVYLLLPVRLQTLWEQHSRKEKGVSPVEQLITFLTDHAETLPSSPPSSGKPTDSPEKKASKKPDKRQDSYQHKQRANVHVVTPAPNYKWDCVLCKTEKHPLFVCPKWQAYTVAQRLSHIQQKNLCQNCLAVGHSTSNCKSTYRCRECQQTHHTTIHQTPSPPTPVNSASVGSSQVPDALMMTAQVILSGPGRHEIQARALIDPRAGISLVSSRIAQRLNLPLTRTSMQFSGVQGTPCKSAKHLAKLALSPLQGDHQVHVQAAVVSTVTNDIPAQEIAPVDELPHLMGLGLADPTFHIPGRIDILLGADVYPQILVKKPMITGAVTDPAAQETIFGWAIVGPVRSKGAYIQPVPTHFAQVQTPEENLDTLLSRFWEAEEPGGANKPLSHVEEQVQSHYANTVSYSSSPPRYQVTLPWRDDVPPLGDSRSQALSQYITNERSILRRNIWRPFQDIVQSYLDLGHAELIPASEVTPEQTYYLPMHCVSKQSSTSTKLRVVFDGSATSTSGISLNQSLMIGPTLHPTLDKILLKFQAYPVAITADISKMYREVELAVPDRDFHRFLWRSTPQQEIQDYRMTRVTFGVSASLYLAVRTLQLTMEATTQMPLITSPHPSMWMTS